MKTAWIVQSAEQIKNPFFGLKIQLMNLIKKINLVILVLACFTYTNAQDNALNTVTDKFIQNQQSILSEKIFAHTDKNFYLTGEILWFKLYYIGASRNKFLDLSKVAYVALVAK